MLLPFPASMQLLCNIKHELLQKETWVHGSLSMLSAGISDPWWIWSGLSRGDALSVSARIRRPGLWQPCHLVLGRR